VIVVADASPLRYLVWIDEVELIPALYGAVWIPPAAARELSQPATPVKVKRWIGAPPVWLHIRGPKGALGEFPSALGAGECEAIALAEEIRADFLLIDDWAGRREAERRELTIQGTLGLLSFAAQNGLIDLPNAIARLRDTSFRASDELILSLLDEDAKRGRR
jgi:predicted nucleic acid-binding protein